LPKRYHIPIVPAPARFRPVGKYGTVDWREDCSRCKNCVKIQCVYGIYRSEHDYNIDPSSPTEPLFDCHACLSCIQGCTKGLLSLSINPEYLALGGDYWRPDLIAATWEQAEAGRIPVSGAGYRGPFSGPGFDSMWTDMSEIVRPTRDGIHGREYINTSVDIGPKPPHLALGPNGELDEKTEPLLEVPIPVILDIPPWDPPNEAIPSARIAAAAALGTLSVVRPNEIAAAAPNHLSSLVPLFEEPRFAEHEPLLQQIRMVEIADGPDTLSHAEQLRIINPDLIVCARLRLEPAAFERVWALYEGGIKVIHLCADTQGREFAGRPRFVKDALRDIHGRLVQEGVRDEVTLIASGGIAAAEHVAKSIVCGADLVAVGLPLLVALGCRVCSAGHNGSCPADMQSIDTSYAVQRIVNLMGAWHSQLIEVLGAMGIREVRRLRGEVGRAMFQEDLEREAFGDLGR